MKLQGHRSSWSPSDSRGGTASGGDGSRSGTGTRGGAYNAAVGAIYTTLPPTGCVPKTVDNTQLFNCGGVWFMPSYGANGVFYRVVPAP